MRGREDRPLGRFGEAEGLKEGWQHLLSVRYIPVAGEKGAT